MNILKTEQGQLSKLSDTEYFGLIKKELIKNGHDKRGTIILSSKDKERMTPEFETAAKSMGFEISPQSRDINGGFVLSCGGVEENCFLGTN